MFNLGYTTTAVPHPTPDTQESNSTSQVHAPTMPHPDTPPSNLEQDQNPHNDSDSEPIQNIIDKLYEEEPLSVRAKRLQKAKLKMKSGPKPTTVKRVKFTSPSQPKKRAVSKSPARKPTTAPTHSTKTHRARSVTKKSCASSQPEVIEISETSTEYTQVDTPEVAQEWRYNKQVPRRSFKFQVTHTHTPIMKRAQKRKASGPSTSAGNPLLGKFPYTRFTNAQISQLFQIYHIKLGQNTLERDVLIPAIQNMDRHSFEQLLLTLDHTDSTKDIYLTLDQLPMHQKALDNTINRAQPVSL